jgi:hypothetical protein
VNRRALTVAVVMALAAAGPAFAQVPELSRTEPIAVGDETIGIGEIEHWARIAAAARDGQRLRKVDFAQAAELVISFRWIAGEAGALGIRVSAARVDRELRRQTRQTFPSQRDFRRFLRESRQTRADLLRRVRVDLLSNRVRARVLRGVPEAEQQERLDAWVADFRARWMAVTRCTARFSRVSSCGDQP